MHEVVQQKIYSHYKGGQYLVLFVADESTNERAGADKVVVYVSLTYGKIKCRDLREFTEMVEWSDGTKKPRFVLSK